MRIKYYIDLLRLKLVRWYIGRETKAMIKDYAKLLDSLEKWEASQTTKEAFAVIAAAAPALMLRYYIFLQCVEPVKNEKSTK